jgi:hypothetical protein
MSPRLRDRLLGKAPLRLIVARQLVCKGAWMETLECGHRVETYQEYLLDERSTLVSVEPHERRRRCRACKPKVAPVLKTKSEIAADQARRALIHARQLQFGSLFDAMCHENGELRAGPTAEELMAQLAHEQAARALKSRKKPPQSVQPRGDRSRGDQWKEHS